MACTVDVHFQYGTVHSAVCLYVPCMQGLPSTYCKDMQEDKEMLFDAVDTMNAVVQIASGVLDTLTVSINNVILHLKTQHHNKLTGWYSLYYPL